MSDKRFDLSVEALSRLIEQMVIDKADPIHGVSGFSLSTADSSNPPIDVSAGYANMLGYAVDEIKTVPNLSLNADYYREDTERYLSTLYQNGRLEYIFYREMVRKDGERIPVGTISSATSIGISQNFKDAGSLGFPNKTLLEQLKDEGEGRYEFHFSYHCRVERLPLRNPPIQPYEFKEIAKLGKNILPFKP